MRKIAMALVLAAGLLGFSRNHYGIFLEGVGKVVHATLRNNHYWRVSVHVKRVVVPSYR